MSELEHISTAKNEQDNLDVICRLCMKYDSNMQCIFEAEINENDVDSHSTIRDFVMSFTLINIVQSDGLPSQICINCVENAKNSYKFKKQCEISDRHLRKLIENNVFEGILDQPTLEDDRNEKTIDRRKNVKDDNKKENRCENSPPYSCLDCSKVFRSVKVLQKHLKCHHKLAKLTCEICDQTFSQPQTLSRHKKIHQENQRNNLCTVCGKGFHRSDDLKRHARTHTNERPYTCILCPKSYKQSSELADHVKTHSSMKNYVCSECGKGLATRNGLYIHMKVHRGEKNHECKICGNKYVTAGELNSHINHIHSHQKPFVCSFVGCSRAFVTKLSLQTHTRSHTGEKPYQCCICHKYLASPSSLQDHKRIHSGEKLKTCNICGQKLGNSQALKKHLRIHSGERPYHCDICWESFICRSSLSSHIKIKHMDKEHQCVQCKKLFALPSKLRQHMKIHNKQDQISFKECGESGIKPVQNEPSDRSLFINLYKDSPNFNLDSASLELGDSQENIKKKHCHLELPQNESVISVTQITIPQIGTSQYL